MSERWQFTREELNRSGPLFLVRTPMAERAERILDQLIMPEGWAWDDEDPPEDCDEED